DDILARGRVPVIVGGTGLYKDSLLRGRTFAEKVDDSLRQELNRQYDELGGEEMLSRLRQFDPGSAAALSANDRHRIVRAFEIYRSTGKTKTQHDIETQRVPRRYDAMCAVLSFKNRGDLYERIDLRVDDMLRRGLTDEVRDLLDMGLTQRSTAMQAIGYKELAEVILHGGDIDEAVEKIKQSSRRYAKRQLSWFRRYDDAIRILWDKTPDNEYGIHILTDYLTREGYNISVGK
ncbi:MAG: tRNA (adenosine(37)-N6)-dimethylallyltransferase MiaA, partial [Oscillospiraceae bacterium]|nr:tRNA (adenosine(37)-N6)-dimethylallyltransferase MiaA [Oscillospiraceae bacterium]